MTTMRVTSVQSNLHWENETENLQMFAQQIAHLKGQTDLIVLPEMFNSGFSMQPAKVAQSMQGNTLKWMQQQAEQLNAAVCGSLAIQQKIAGKSAYVNKFIFVHPDGSVDQYNKRHCFRMSGENTLYQGGGERVVINYRDWRILPQVCYDLRFPVFSRNRDDYDLAIYVANWPAVRRMPWRILLPARAVENLAYVVAVNRLGEDANAIDHSGDSLVIDFKGSIVCDHQSAVSVHTNTLDLSTLQSFRDKFPAWLDADDFSLEM